MASISREYIILSINKQLESRLKLKRKWNAQKLGVLSLCRRLHKWLGYIIFGLRAMNKCDPQINLDLGVDEFGRDIGSGLKLYLDLLAKRGVQVHSLIVLGSRAKKRERPWSDTDVLLITESVQELRSNQKLVSDTPLFLGIEAECYSRQEIVYMMGGFNLTFLDAVYWGVVVYDDGFWFEILRQFQKIESKYRLPHSAIKRKLFPI